MRLLPNESYLEGIFGIIENADKKKGFLFTKSKLNTLVIRMPSMIIPGKIL